MANVRELSDNGRKKAVQENGFENEHDFKNHFQCGQSEYDMWIDIDTNEIILRRVNGSRPDVSTEMYTTAR